jgi:hypothetical protein
MLRAFDLICVCGISCSRSAYFWPSHPRGGGEPPGKISSRGWPREAVFLFNYGRRLPPRPFPSARVTRATQACLLCGEEAVGGEGRGGVGGFRGWGGMGWGCVFACWAGVVPPITPPISPTTDLTSHHHFSYDGLDNGYKRGVLSGAAGVGWGRWGA